MITAGDFRNGVTFEMDGQVMQVVEFQHVKPGKGAAFVRTKMKNVITGAVTETSFNPTAKFESATIDRKTMEYSYNDGNLYYFMDPETYELIPIDESALGSNFRFVKENMECVISSYKGKVFLVEPPTFVELEVTEISPRECTKREGIQSVLDALDPNHGTVYGIGDASNDISLMNAVDVGIAMGNAPDYLKKRADYITDSVDKDGVVKALEHFGLV